MKYFQYIITFIFIQIGYSQIQVDPTDNKAQKRGRIAYFIYTSMPEGVENPMLILSGGDKTLLTLSKRGVSLPVKIPKEGMIRVIREVEKNNDPKQPAYITLAQAQVSEDIHKALVILTPYSKPVNGLVFQTKIIDLSTFRGGDGMYLNMTRLNVGVEFGSEKFGVAPGAIHIHRLPNLETPTNYAIKYNFQDPTENVWRMISASTVVAHKTRREICIFSWDARYSRIDYHGITFPVELEQ